MGGVRTTSGLDGLFRDMSRLRGRAMAEMPGVVSKNVERGQKEARRLASAQAGPHGLLYFKRITSEMTGTLKGEFGPTGTVFGNAIGAGWRHISDGPNTDLAKAADIVADDFARDVRNLPRFW